MTTADMFSNTAAMNMPFNAEDFFQVNVRVPPKSDVWFPRSIFPQVSDEFPVWDNFMDYWNPATFSMDGPQ